VQRAVNLFNFLGKYDVQKTSWKNILKQHVNKLHNKCEFLGSTVQEHKFKEIKFQEKICDIESNIEQKLCYDMFFYVMFDVML
jgi:hypothetical protein